MGADFLIMSPLGVIGIQRKAWRDLISSVQGKKGGDRLYREVQQLRGGVDVAVLLVEGCPKWTADGELLDDYATFKRSAWWGLLFSVRLEGVWVVHAKDEQETKDALAMLERWAHKPKHTSLRSRPGPKAKGWGGVKSKDWRAFMWMSFDGIGEDTAYKLAERFERMPFKLTVDDAELLAVEGVGKGRLEKIKGLLG